MIRPLHRVLLVGVLLLAGCAAPSGAPAPAPPTGAGGHEGHGQHVMLPATGGEGYTEADVVFMQMMMGHHAQAVTMSDMATSRQAGERVLALAQRIDISQRDEMALMANWLRDRGQVVPDQQQMDAMQMPGMVSAPDMARLAQARGEAFDRLFLNLMIEHHLGAIRMVDDLFDTPGAAQDPDLFRFVTDVSADQLDEISVMERILNAEDPSPRSSSR